jgi:hypothetical protein
MQRREVVQIAAKKVNTTAAYKNVRSLRTVLRQLYRGSGLDPKYGTHSAAASLKAKVAAAYELSQQIPSYEGLPDGKDANSLMAIKGLLKSHNATHNPHVVLESIKMIIDPTLVDFKPKVKAEPKKAYAIPAPSVPANVSKSGGYDMTPVNKEVPGTWGFQVPYYMIKKHTPMTWGACLQWVVKLPGQGKPGKPGDKFYVHPHFATESQLKYHWAVKGAAKEAVKEKALEIVEGLQETTQMQDAVAQAIAPLMAEPPLHATDLPDDPPNLDLTEYDDDEGSF